MIQRFRNSKACKPVSIFLLLTFLSTLISPATVYALTGGPSQPEVQSFTPVTATDMVNLFTGDFNYNIPLLDVDGYPINLSYESGITMEQQASWVGLGWNINPGSILRNVRGLPDDFSGDEVVKEQNMKPNRTYGASVGVGAEIAGLGLGGEVSAGLRYNNYVGLALENSVGFSFSKGSKFPLTANLGLTSSTINGLDMNASVGLSTKELENNLRDMNGGLSANSSLNSRRGIEDVTFSAFVNLRPSIIVRPKKKDIKIRNNFGGHSSIDFAVNSYIPQIQFPQNSLSLLLSLKLGGVITIVDASLDIKGYYSQQTLSKKTETVSSFGYLYTRNGIDNDNALLDFNREKEGAFSKNTPALPLTSYTYDIYNVTGQGVGGMYRPYKNNFEYVFDKHVSTNSTSGNLGLELGAGGIASTGLDVTVNDVNSKSGKWINNNKLLAKINYGIPDNDINEEYYFKRAGELSVDPESEIFTNTLRGENPIRVKLTDVGGMETVASDKFESTDEVPYSFSNTGRTVRQKRNQPFQIITKGDYQKFATDPNLWRYFANYGADHHIGEIRITKTDGSRYSYGIPVYNTKQVEVTFNASGLPHDCATGLVQYSAGDNTSSNNRGVDGYFSKTTLKDYAHSYLLTSVLSPGFVDVTGNGPTDDDLGTYVKFDYTFIDNYKWRTPYEEYRAIYNEGLKTISGNKDGDDKANYLYGEKEVAYLNQIVTKNYIAIFHITDREDGLGVSGENGGKNTSIRLQKLDSIRLFSKVDFYTNGEKAIPIKVVHFEYDYSQCKGVPNNSNTDPEQSGKLTLRRVYFTYGNSEKGRLSPYKFTYNQAYNHDYQHNAFDRWGYYKEEKDGVGCNLNDSISNSEFPYTDQEKGNKTDLWAGSWELQTIKLPSGGEINVSMESDDYAYVQDKEATQMFKISGIGHTDSDYNTSNELDNNGDIKIFFKLQENITEEQGREYFYRKYLQGLDWIYFKAMTEVNKSSKNNGYEYVYGYAKLKADGYGLVDNGGIGNGTQYAYIILEEVNGFNPISQAALQFARVNTPKQAYNYTLNDNDGIESVIKFLADGGFVSGAIEALMGPDNFLYNQKKLGRWIKTDKSWIKLKSPTQSKQGGGSRVKQITLTDNWNDMTTSGDYSTASYIQEYEYTTYGDNNEIISSGVAAYEPIVGGDENALKSPVYFGNDKALLAPSNRFYMEEPFGETFYPAPVVGYSKVKVKSSIPAEIGINKHANGYVENEFYTAKDYPVRTYRTDPNDQEKKSGFLAQFLSLNVKHYMTVSQGFSVVLNDMHGKPKSVKVYAEGKTAPISGVQYYYKDNYTMDNGNRIYGNKLDNTTTVIDKNGKVSQAMVGVDYDFINDFREQQTEALNIGESFDLYFFTIFIIPIFLPAAWPSVNTEKTRFRSASTTKVINQYGILDKTIAWDQNSNISTDVIALDAETGQSVVTQTVNEYDDSQYSLNYPASWVNPKMGPQYRRQDLIEAIHMDFESGMFTNVNFDDSYAFIPGDRVAIYNTDMQYVTKAWVWDYNTDFNHLYIMNDDGDILTGIEDCFAKVLNPAQKNMLESSVGSILCMQNPLDNLTTTDKLNISAENEVLNASAIDYSEVWKTFCDCTFDGLTDNPYLNGRLGQWRPVKSYYFETDRAVAGELSGDPIRYDGIYKDFSPMWTPPGETETEWNQNLDGWKYTSRVTNYSPFGPSIEEVNSAGIYSAALYGYNNSLPLAVGTNTMRQEMAYDGFEDYDLNKCRTQHFNFFEFKNNVTDAKSHSGRNSIKILPGTGISTTRKFNGLNK